MVALGLGRLAVQEQDREVVLELVAQGKVSVAEMGTRVWRPLVGRFQRKKILRGFQAGWDLGWVAGHHSRHGMGSRTLSDGHCSWFLQDKRIRKPLQQHTR
uniref:Uncharacterized protein n=1 Tax=Cacopsylla melanoneura TaxID=428564 RepID=A0A8D8R4F6_9HEMI